MAEEIPSQTVFPVGELYEPSIADPKEPQFSTGFHTINSSGGLGRFTGGIVSYGEHFGLIRWHTDDGNQWQLSIVGAVFAQFNLSANSKDLLNADYTIGVSATHRNGNLSYRLRALHQSTHLGDEYLLGPSPPERINYSLEAVDFMAARTWNDYRLYGGATYLLHVEPSTLDRVGIQMGGDYRSTVYQFLGGYLTAGIDVSAFEGVDWQANTAVKFGLEYGKPGSGHRRIRVMLEAYDGKVPFGQFYDVDVKSYGITIYFLF